MHQIGGQTTDQWANAIQDRKQVEKLGSYTFLSVISGE